MAYRQATEKTIVFHYGDLSKEAGSAGRQMDDETRELPLISGRFAGRHWEVEELLREEEEKKTTERKHPVSRRRWLVPALAGAALSFALLTGSLLGQARLTQLTDQVLTAREEVIVLRGDPDLSLNPGVFAESTVAPVEYAAKTLGQERRGQDQTADTLSRNEDRTTVLGIRRGQGFAHFCRTIIDKVGEYLH